MSRLFYHTMQDNAGNLLFDVTGTMRLAGSGTLATIYGDEALTVILPNPMTNHPSFGSFKCFLGAGDFDFYMAKSGYTFETLTGVQGHGTMAQQDASAVVITGGSALLNTLTVTQTTTRGSLQANGGIYVPNYTPSSNDPYALYGDIVAGANRFNCFMGGTAPNFFNGQVYIGANVPSTIKAYLAFDKNVGHGLGIRNLANDAGGNYAVVFLNTADTPVGSIATTATTTAYNTTSDARLKKHVEPLTGALGVVQALRPISHRWRADDSPGVGFLAHEVADVVDGVITGNRDAVDEEGQIVPQMIDYSKLVPWLVSACQDLAQQVQALTARLDAASV